MKILFLSRWFPFPPNNGSKLRIASLLRALNDKHEVTLLGFSDDPAEDMRNADIHLLCRDVHLVRWKAYNPRSIKSFLGLFHPAPRFIVDTFSPEMANLIRQKVIHGSYDVVVASQVDMARYAGYFNSIPAIFEEVESGIYFAAENALPSIKERTRQQLTRYKWRVYLRDLLSKFQAATVASKREQDILLQAFPGFSNVHVIPNCIQSERYQPIHEHLVPGSLVFTGSFRYFANYDAMVWFIDEVFPRILAKLPDAVLTITGDHANKPLPDLTNVNLTGFIDDIMPLISKAWCSVVPIRVGGGTRLKILESMALGTPVVATTKGAEGLDVQSGRHLLIADTPEEFAAAVVRLVVEPGLRDYLSTHAKALVQEKYDCTVVLPKFLDLVDSVSREANR